MNRRSFLQTLVPTIPMFLHCSAAADKRLASLKFPPLPEIRLPKVHELMLSNRLQVLLVENHELPLVEGFAFVRTGSLFDPPHKVGLASLTGRVLRTGGTVPHTGEQLDELLESIAASIESSIGQTIGEIGLSTLSDHLDRVLELYAEVVTAPAFRQDKLELAKTRLRSVIARRNDEAAAIARREFRSLIYGKDTPYGWIIEYEHLDRIERQDLVDFYRRYFFPENMTLGLYGDFKVDRVGAKLEEVFRDWKSVQPEVPPFPKVQTKAVPGVFVANKPESQQTFFRMGHLGGKLNDPDYPALDVMAEILGGGFNSRLFRRVRTELGYAYSIGARWSAAFQHPGLFVIGGSTMAERTVRCIQVCLEEVGRIRHEKVTEEELRYAKQKVLNSFVFNFDTPAKTLYRVMLYRYYGYPEDFIFQYRRGVEAVTADDVVEAARRRVHPERFTIVTVGPTKRFLKELEGLGLPIEKIDLTIPLPKQSK